VFASTEPQSAEADNVVIKAAKNNQAEIIGECEKFMKPNYFFLGNNLRQKTINDQQK
jgi:hypothetical protein